VRWLIDSILGTGGADRSVDMDSDAAVVRTARPRRSRTDSKSWLVLCIASVPILCSQ
jgi:hypothetical protein